jgi:myo-inositol-1(or 4)-monophosphatase
MDSTPDTDRLLACCIEAATTAGRHALANHGRRQDALSTDRHDVKLRLDVECQAIAEKVVTARFPAHAILGEESATDIAGPAPGACEWIIDPIDGTVNFSHGLPQWCCSVAVRRDGRTLAGAVYAPVFDELYTASAGGPATCNGTVLAVSATDSLAAAIVHTGLDKNVAPELPPLEIFKRIAGAVQRPRIMGSAALDICYVAAGKADAYFESGIYIWDLAAAALIVEQAGGKAEILVRQADRRLCFAASNGRLHDAFKRVLNVA